MLGEVGDGDVRSRWGAIGGEGGDHFLVGQSLDRECVGDLAAQQTERGIELVGAEKAQHVGGNALAQTDFDTWVCLAEAGEQPGDVKPACGQERSDPDPSAQHAAKLVDLFAGGLHFGEHPAGSRCDRLPRLGRGHAAAGALEQRGAELLFEPLDLMRERRLREVELLSGAREVAVARYRLHASQLPQLHANDRNTRLLR